MPNIEEFNHLKGELNRLLPTLSKWRVEELRAIISEFHTNKWKRHRTPKYGTINKGFTTAELNQFLSVIGDDRYRLLFKYQAYLGLRIGEVIKLNVKDINFNTRILKVHTEKAASLDTLCIPRFLFDETTQFIRSHTKEIDSAEGYLFYADKRRSFTTDLHVDQDYMRNIFRYYLQIAGLDEVYDTTSESNPRRTRRRLHRLTTHSLRHHAITMFSKSNSGNLPLTKRFARHQSVSSTQVYIYTSNDELYKAIDTAYAPLKSTVQPNQATLRPPSKS